MLPIQITIWVTGTTWAMLGEAKMASVQKNGEKQVTRVYVRDFPNAVSHWGKIAAGCLTWEIHKHIQKAELTEAGKNNYLAERCECVLFMWICLCVHVCSFQLWSANLFPFTLRLVWISKNSSRAYKTWIVDAHTHTFKTIFFSRTSNKHTLATLGSQNPTREFDF